MSAIDGSHAVLTERQKSTGLQRAMVRQIVFELGLPLATYYGLRAAGIGAVTALIAGSLLVVPWIAVGLVRRRRIDVMSLFTITVLAAGALVSLVTGDPRLLLVRDAWVGGLLGLWMLASVPTRLPFMLIAGRTVVVAKIGEAGARAWAAQWNHDATFRHHMRRLSAIWGAVFSLDVGVRVILAYTLPLDAVPLVSGLQWMAVLALLLLFHVRYVGRHGLKV